MSFNKRLEDPRYLERIVGVPDPEASLDLRVTKDSDLVTMLRETNGRGYFDDTSDGRLLEGWLSDAAKNRGLKLDTLTHIFRSGGRYTFPSMAFDEALRNSVECGANFGQLGPIDIRGIVGKSIQLTIDDPGEGFDFDKLGSMFNFRRQRVIDGLGSTGHWLDGINRFKDVDVWFERLAQGFRTRLVFAHQGETEPMVADQRPRGSWLPDPNGGF